MRKYFVMSLFVFTASLIPTFGATIKTDSKYGAQYLRILYAYNPVIKKNGALISYKMAYPYHTFASACKRLGRGQKITTNCGTPTNWALRDMGLKKANDPYFGANEKTGILGSYNKKMKNHTTLYTRKKQNAGVGYTVKQAVSKGLLKPGDILGFKVHTVTYTGDGYYCFDGGRKANYKKNGFLVNYKNNWTDLKITSVIRWNKTGNEKYEVNSNNTYNMISSPGSATGTVSY